MVDGVQFGDVGLEREAEIREERQRAYTTSHYDKAVIEKEVELLEQRG